MKKETILHIPMSEYAHGLDERRIVLRLRAARGDLERVTLWYGDTACRKTPIDWFRSRWSASSRTNTTTGGS